MREPGGISGAEQTYRNAARVVAPISLFVAIYLAAFVAGGLFLRQYVQWCALFSVGIATLLMVRIFEQGRFDLGLLVRPRLAAGDFVLGVVFSAFLVLTSDGLIIFFSHLRQTWMGAFPSMELALVFVPAALHEELAFRGYAYQKLRQWNRTAAIAISSVVFALLHTGNVGVSPLAVVNIVIAGVMLALAYERFRRLWFPIGMHLAWNVVSGPVLGFPVSGFASPQSLLRVTGTGAAVVTGRGFGIEASICMTVVEIAGIVALLRSSNGRVRTTHEEEGRG